MKFAIIHNQGLGDMVYFLHGCACVSKFPSVYIVSNSNVAEFLRENLLKSKVIHINFKKNIFLFFILCLIYRPYISHRVSKSSSKLISLLQYLKIIRSPIIIKSKIRLASNINKCIPNGHLARRGLYIANSIVNLDFFSEMVTAEVINKAKRNIKKILIHPGSGKSQKFKRWPIDNFEKLIEKLQEFEIVMLLGDEDVDLCDDANRIISRFDNVYLEKSPNFKKLRELIEGVDLIVANDNGIGHFASLFNSNILSIFGPSNEKKTSPIGTNAKIIFSLNRPTCSPCITRNNANGCDHPICMVNISIDSVYMKIHNMLEN